MISLISCVDDFENPYDTFVEGYANVHVDINFENETSVNLQSRATGGLDGRSIQNINTFCMLVYDESTKTLVEKYMVYDRSDSNNHHPDVSNIVPADNQDNRLDSEKTGDGTLQDNRAGRLSYDLKIYSGRYVIIGVANMGDLSAYNEQIKTIEGLRSIKRTWESNIADNSEMIGVFSLTDDRIDYREDKGQTISATTKQLHCWLYRLASKVTVAFDGSELYDDVQVFIETITLKDIPTSCSLGLDNEPGKGETTFDRATLNRYLLSNGGQIRIQDDVPTSGAVLSPANYFHVCNGEHRYFGIGDDNKESIGENENMIDKSHLTTSMHSLFFYENMQGKGKSKKQSQDGIKIDFPTYTEGDTTKLDNGWKDRKPFGTYVEVKGFYRCSSRDGHVSSGPIIYRFMLGQDAETDYNAARNNHYKLTLKLKGYGNDADWHIEYQIKSDLHIASPQYISYLYGKKMMAYLRIVGEIDPQDPYIYATIVGNEGYNPLYYNCNPDDFKKITDIPAEEETAADKTYWRPWGNDTDNFPPVTTGFFSSTPVVNDGPWNSFLSLRQTNVLKVTPPGYGDLSSIQTPIETDYNMVFWKEKKKGWRIYQTQEGSHDDATDGNYNIQVIGKNADGVINERILMFPLYTNPKELVTKTGFVGNNPYSAYPRKMKVRFSAHMKKQGGGYEWKHVYLDVIQVRRVENPKGIWRKAGSTEPFHVTLMRRPNEMGDFQSFDSEGKWSAEIVSSSSNTGNIITLSSTPVGSGDGKPQLSVRRIEGASEHPIDFNVNFNGNQGFAVIRIRYHNYTCEHDIFCRNGYGETPESIVNGYGDVDVAGTGTHWSSFNTYRFKKYEDKDKKDQYEPVLTKSPLDPGSFFRRGSYTAILALNNTVENGKYGNDGVFAANLNVPAKFAVYKPDGTKTTNSDGLAWGELLASKTNPDADGIDYFANWPVSNPNNDSTHIATITEYYELVSEANIDSDENIKKAYGVVYADGATTVKTSVDDAMGYSDDNAQGNPSPKGMRGIIVYHPKTHKQIFLPIGETGHGRRKDSGFWQPTPADPDGGLRYASRTGIYPDPKYTPLFHDLYLRPGAIYWCRKCFNNGSSNVRRSAAFDINYYSMGFEGYGGGAATLGSKSKSDACFIRTVNSKAKAEP